MDIKERVKRLGKYFKEMQITTTNEGQQVIYIIVAFPTNWPINKDVEKKFNINVINDPETPSNYWFVAPIDLGEEPLFDAVDYCINEVKDAIERNNLLNKKIDELNKLFESEEVSLEELRTLRFTYDKKKEPADGENQEEKPLITKKRAKKNE